MMNNSNTRLSGSGAPWSNSEMVSFDARSKDMAAFRNSLPPGWHMDKSQVKSTTQQSSSVPGGRTSLASQTRLMTQQKERALQKQRSAAQKAIEIETQRFKKEKDIAIRK